MNEGFESSELLQLASSYRTYDAAACQTVATLNDQRQTRTIEAFLGLCEIVRTDRTELAESTGFTEMMEFVWNQWESFLEIVSDPTFTFWVTILDDLVNPYQLRRTASNDLNLYIETSQISEADFLRQHLIQFGAFILSAAIFNQATVKLRHPVLLKFPWLPRSDFEYARRDENQTLSVNGVRNGALGNYSEVDQFIPLEIARTVPEINLDHMRVQVHANALPFHLKHIERWRRITGWAERAEIAKEATAALQLAEQFILGLIEQAGIIVNTLVPMSTDGVTPMASGSYTRLFGTVFLARSADPRLVAEMFIHEFCHNKLTLLEDATPFFQGFSRNEPFHYSPWRDTLRSAEGVLHALYVHSEVAKFWQGVLKTAVDKEARDLAQRRVWTLLNQLRMGVDDLRQTAKLTEVGAALVDDIDRSIREWLAESKPIDPASRPFFSEMKNNSGLASMTLREALEAHRLSVWQLASPAMRKPPDTKVVG